MYEGLNSPSIHTPQNISEYSQTVLRYPNARIWAGGTNIMSQEKAYPSRETNSEIVYLAQIEELKKIARNDRMIEIGSTVTLNELLKNNNGVIPSILKENIIAVGSPLITDRATIGGSIAARDNITTIPGTLITLGATAELRYIRKKTVKSKWIPLSQMLNESKDGRISLPERGLITRIRVSLANYDYSYFKEVGNYVDNPEETVAVAFTATANEGTLTTPHFAVTFPTQGIVYSKDLDNIFMQLHFPLSSNEFNQLKSITYTFIDSVTPNITRLQRARLNSILEELINQINARVLVDSSSLS
ncbi:MAG: FAD binding domain-containing protein [Spirochaetales bacterium]|nr:FAD binding domain-containing protein [Candidatus Physcosoma equi]